MNKIFSNLKIGKKLFIGYAILIILAAILCISNMLALLEINNSYTNLQMGIIEGNHLALKLGTEYAGTRQSLIRAIITCENGSDGYRIYLKEFDNSIDEIEQIGENLINSLKIGKGFNEAEKNYLIGLTQEVLSMITIDYVSIRNTAESRITSTSLLDDELMEELTYTITKISDIAIKIDEKIGAVTEITDKKATEIGSQTSLNTHTIILALFIFASIAMAISIISAILITRNIRNPITELSNAAREIAKGNFDIPIRYNAKDEIGVLSNSFGEVRDIFSLLADGIHSTYSKLLDGELEIFIDEDAFSGDYKKMASAVNNIVNYMAASILSVIDCAQAYASGNFEAKAKRHTGSQAILSETFDELQLNLKSVSNDLNLLIGNAIEGKLNVKIDSNRYKGDWKEISKGLNSLLEAVETPISEVCSVMEQVSSGKFSANVQGNYKGSFAMLKNDVNKTIVYSDMYIRDISYILEQISDQHLDISVTKEYLGDFEVIGNAITKILDTFNMVIGEFSASAEQVSAGARLITESSASLSQGTVDQAGALEETSATIELISKQTTINAQNSEEVRVLSFDAKNKGLESKRDMEEMLVSMSDIQTASSNILRIIKVIDEIAFQINLLALNAAVEAARAGIHGKGFSVIAEEVRNLAGKSKQAASETANLITQTVEFVTCGTEIANNTAGSLNKMVEQISEIAALIDAISFASKEQVSSVQQINDGISQISAVTQANAATSEESASMSQELASRTEVLKNLLSQFKYRQRAD